MPLTGYTSSSENKHVALSFAFHDLSPTEVPVLIKITFRCKRGYFKMTKEYTAYPEEEEVLIQDGLKYRIIGN